MIFSTRPNSTMSTAMAGRKQAGLATLAVALILLVIATIATLSLGVASLNEQKASGLDVRHKEVYSAATSGLEHAISNVKRILPSANWAWDTTDASCALNGINYPVSGSTVTVAASTMAKDKDGNDSVLVGKATTALNADSYAHTITYTLKTCLSADPSVIEVSSTAAATNDSHVNKTVKVDLVKFSLIAGSLFDGPPLLVEGCIDSDGDGTYDGDGITGSPRIYAEDGFTPETVTDPVTGATYQTQPTAVGTINGTVSCLEHEPGSGSSGVEFQDWESTNPSDTIEITYQNKASLNTADSMSQTFFGMNAADTDAFMKENADNSNGPIYYIDSSANNIANGTYGSLTDPVVVYIAGCPSFLGGSQVYGIVYQAADCANNGLGSVEIWGTLAISGNLESYNANTKIHQVDYSDEIGPDDETFTKITMLPGSWRDF